jgi:DNA-binding MarR family transcriptional regulator
MTRKDVGRLRQGLKKTRQELLRRLVIDLGREISTNSFFFHEAVARKVGLNATDTRCLDLIIRAGEARLTAGGLGKATGLTTGAVTAILDRLERAGMVLRVRDAEDRRKVFVQPDPQAIGRVAALYDELGAAAMKLASSYETHDLQVITDFLERNVALLREGITNLS